MYVSDLFKKSYAFAKIYADQIFILSAKYGLLKPEDEIEPYNLTLSKMNAEERKKWAIKVRTQFAKTGLSCTEPCFFLCGKNYYEGLIKYFPNALIMCKGLKIGERLKWLKLKINKEEAKG